jgi:hypothetical protein
VNKLLFFVLLIATTATGQTDSTKVETILSNIPDKRAKWYDNVSIRGYVQIRYNRLLETNDKLKCEQCDRSIGEDGGFFMRRARIILFGQIHERVYFYFQPDFASSASSTGLHFAQIRDAYFDVGLNKKNEFRFRIGQSKVPYGFENMQSSQNRLALDRNDALNSAVSNERDMGVFFYWAPDKVRKRFAYLVNEGLKGSGDYGVLGFGVFNGQTANKPELNESPHAVLRATYPVQVGKKQIIEASLQGYTGQTTIASDLVSKGTKIRADYTYMDERIAGTLVLYPQPIGIQAEYNIGRGPEFNAATDSIELRKLSGGYVYVNGMFRWKKQLFFPFVRGQYYNGGKKFELDARSYSVRELEIGVEWQPIKNFEFVAMYTISKRRFEDFVKQDNTQQGRLLRLQAQVNF